MKKVITISSSSSSACESDHHDYDYYHHTPRTPSLDACDTDTEVDILPIIIPSKLYYYN